LGPAIALVLTLVGCSAIPAPDHGASPLDAYRRDGRAFPLVEVGPDLSGITYAPEFRRFLLIQNGGARLFEYEPDLRTRTRVLQLRGGPSNDFEAIAWLGESRIALAHELNRVVLVQLPQAPDAYDLEVDPARDDVVELVLPPPSRGNRGLEGLCFDPEGNAGGGILFALQESSPRRIFRLQRSRPGTALDTTAVPLTIDEPFNAEAALEGIAEDLSGCVFDPRTGRLLILSQRSSVLLDVRLDGTVVRRLRLPGVLRGGAAQYEGVTLGPADALYLVSEPAAYQRTSRAVIFRLVGP
jgi:uncharacterized protein YjiK